MTTKRPAFMFYPRDYLSDPCLARCSHEEKGVWVDLLCMFHESDEYGVIRWPLTEIARSMHVDLGLLISLVGKGVLRGKERISTLDTPWISHMTSKGLLTAFSSLVSMEDEKNLEQKPKRVDENTFGIQRIGEIYQKSLEQASEKEVEQAFGFPLDTLRISKGSASPINPAGSSQAIFGSASGTGSLPYYYRPVKRKPGSQDVVLIEECDGPVWYCARMIRDEHLRNLRAAIGATSLDNPAVPRPKNTAPDIQGNPEQALRTPLRTPSGVHGDPSPSYAFASSFSVDPVDTPPKSAPVTSGTYVPTAGEKSDDFSLEPSPEGDEKGKIPNAPYEQIVDLYHRILPTLPKVVKGSEHRRGPVRQRWKELFADGTVRNSREAIAYLEAFFRRVNTSDWLMGRTARNNGFSANFDWLFGPQNFVKVLGGNYDNRSTLHTGLDNLEKWANEPTIETL